MKKSILGVIAVFGLIAGTCQQSIADGMPYEPVFETIPITESISTAPAKKIDVIANAPKTNQATVVHNAVEADNLQNALTQLDSAQIEIRNQLIQYKSEYTNIDNKYREIKAQRKLKAKQVKDTEKKIKNLDATKEKIRKNMNY